MFTQKHYEAIAQVIYQERCKIRQNGFEHPSEVFETEQRLLVMANFTLGLIEYLKKDSGKFNQFLFIQAAHKDLTEKPDCTRENFS